MSKNATHIKLGFDYSHLDKYGLIKENTPLDDKTVLIGKVLSNTENPKEFTDESIGPKKGQLGFVDKSFITEGEEGKRVAKVRVREQREPTIGDKMASRSGQKGTVGLVIPEEDMPFTADGIRPDMIINPHAIPSRMTIGQLVESLFGKLCASYGTFGDCTAFAVKGSNISTYGPLLTKVGFHSSGNQLLYNGQTGEPLTADIYMGPTYYMRLKHMVKDKINYRATGPRTALTRQTVQGRANDGGLRIGEMERDGIIAHGAAAFLQESFLIRGDEYFMAICNKTGAIAIYNESLNLFLSPFADGPIAFSETLDGKMNIKNISRFGRSFSIVRIPYSLKLLMQELQAMNIQMRIITDANIDQLTNMSFSNNINKVLDVKGSLSDVIPAYVQDMKGKFELFTYGGKANNVRDINESAVQQDVYGVSSPQYPEGVSPAYSPTSPDFAPGGDLYNSGSPIFSPNGSPSGPPPPGAKFEMHSPDEPPPGPFVQVQTEITDDPALNELYASLGEKAKNQIQAISMRDRKMILQQLKAGKDKKTEAAQIAATTAILDIPEEPATATEDNNDNSSNDNSSNDNSSGSETKKVIVTGTESDNSQTGGGTRKIIF